MVKTHNMKTLIYVFPGYLRSTLAELAIKESVDESVETGLQLAEERREMERTCYPRKCEVRLAGYVTGWIKNIPFTRYQKL